MFSIIASLREDPVSKILNSAYYPISSDNSFRTAAAYTPVTAPFPLKMLSLKNDSGTTTYHKFASQYWEYKAVVAFTGGRPPFRVTLISAPPGATIGGSSQTQTMTRTLDVIGGGVYNFELPLYNNLIRWQPTTDDVGTTKRFRVMIEDNSGQIIYNTHYVTVGEAPFIYADGTLPDDTGAGTWASPKKTFDVAHNNAEKICVYKTAGTYAVTFGGLNNSDNRVRNHIAIVDGVVFDMNSQEFGCSTASTDVAFINIEFNGSLSSTSNPRIFHNSGKCDRWMMYKCKWRNVSKGTQLPTGDNPGCMVFKNISGGTANTVRDLPDSKVHTNICLIECDIDSTVETQQVDFFSVRGVLVERCTATLPATAQVSNGSVWINGKDSCSEIFVRFNVCNGGVQPTGVIAFLNQQSWWCDVQEVSYNIIAMKSCNAITFNLKSGDTALVGNVAGGQRLAAENQRVIRNTIIADASEVPMVFHRWGNVAGMEPVIVEGNLCATTAASIIGTGGSNNDGYTLVGLNPKILKSDFNSQLKLTGASRATYLGKQGAEIASTLVT